MGTSQLRMAVALTCACWCAVSSTGSIVNKLILQSYPYPMTLALTSLLSIPVYAFPLIRFQQISQFKMSKFYLIRFILPLSIGKALAVFSAYFSLSKVPVSYAHTVKATMPLFAVFCSRIVLGEIQTVRVYLSLIPIILGVIIASVTELSFNVSGLLTSLLSTFLYAFMNVLVKKILRDTDVEPLLLLAVQTQMAACLFLPIWGLHDALPLWEDITHHHKQRHVHFVWLLAASGLLSFGQNLCAFTLIHKLSALSYAVANATKRVIIIGASLLTLHNPVTVLNVFGMFVAIFGVFLYNRAKDTEKESSLSASPLSRTYTTLSDASLLTNKDQDLLLTSMNANDSSQIDNITEHRHRISDYNYMTLENRSEKAKFIIGNGDVQNTNAGQTIATEKPSIRMV